MGHLHLALLHHALLGREEDPQAGGGDVLELLKVDGQRFHAVQRLVQRGLQLRGGGGVQPALQGNGQGSSFF